MTFIRWRFCFLGLVLLKQSTNAPILVQATNHTRQLRTGLAHVNELVSREARQRDNRLRIMLILNDQNADSDNEEQHHATTPVTPVHVVRPVPQFANQLEVAIRPASVNNNAFYKPNQRVTVVYVCRVGTLNESLESMRRQSDFVPRRNDFVNPVMGCFAGVRVSD